MKIRATFIGINRHEHPDIRELTGARPDATALWALFSDTLADLDATLLVDEEATKSAIKYAMDVALGDAGPDDIAIFCFSGHGTHDHRLVTYDADCNALAATTISMDELAEHFKKSKARAILCILDCCFSGGAPAKVLEQSPISRIAASPFDAIVGKGRILIAASAPNEAAWEQPGTGHGLLTKSLIDVLTGSDEVNISLTSAVDEITTRTRTEAERIGVAQNPVFINHVEGGLIFPRLIPGKRYYKAFPERKTQALSGAIEELASFGIPPEVIGKWTPKYAAGLNALQLEAVNRHRVLLGNSLLIVAPTSSGKTLIGEVAAIRSVADGQKAVFLLPYRALANEKYEDFAATYGALGIRVARCTGDYSDQAALIMSGRYDIALLTYEMFLAVALSSPTVLMQLGLVVVDEGQFITDPNRGIVVELLLTLLIRARDRGINPQLLVLSAVIGNINAFDQWLGCEKLVTTERPVPLLEGVLDRSGTYEYLDEKGERKVEQLLPPHAIQQRREKPSSQDVIVPLVRQLVRDKEKIIVFRNMRGPAEGCAEYLSKELGLPAVTDAIEALPAHDTSGSSDRLRSCLMGGTAFHNTNLGPEERAIVETYFRNPSGGIEALAATTTLAAGINTPASTVILAENEFVGEDGRPFTVAEYKNMIGRAGRLGYNEKGKSILLAENSIERRQLFQRYVLGTPEPVRSSFSSDALPTWVLRLLSQVRKVPRTEVSKLLVHTFGGYLQVRADPSWAVALSAEMEHLLERMLRAGLAEDEGGQIQLTLLGRACGRSSLSFESALRLVELLKQRDPKQLESDDLVALLQVLQEADDVYTPLLKKGTTESRRITDAQQRYGSESVRLLQRFANETQDYWARCKRAAILWDWMHGVSTEEIERHFSPTPYQGRVTYGDIRRIADATRFHLRSAQQVIAVLVTDDVEILRSIDATLESLEVGLPRESLGLLDMRASLNRGQYLALHQAGVRSKEATYELPKEQIVAIVGQRGYDAIEKTRPATAKTNPRIQYTP
ncbi:MAG TPA: DEAD/DEAH box helicase [Usitatibacter sp.]|nr:DEAD/DEAH box helicase [Usitatibacter sp.]